MKIVIQCAGTKKQQQPNAGFYTADHQLVKFVADPKKAPKSEHIFYAHPDDISDNQQTWRERLLEYNKSAEKNLFHLFPAYQLYDHKVYQALVKRFGIEKVFILSAGWGLIAADFLIPDYDITFSNAKNVESYAQRKKKDRYDDLCQIVNDGEDIIFVGGKDYQPLFKKLTADLSGLKKIFYNATQTPVAERGYCFERFITTQKTNWQYTCAQALIDGKI
ncbi:MAG: hypothetical protein HKK67_02595 [Chlorobiaceae bacterium]|nr:hypothetical protein [Chlorobiaceae bacterium]